MGKKKFLTFYLQIFTKKDTFSTHYYCANCFAALANKHGACHVCDHSPTKGKHHFFLCASLKAELQRLYGSKYECVFKFQCLILRFQVKMLGTSCLTLNDAKNKILMHWKTSMMEKNGEI